MMCLMSATEREVLTARLHLVPIGPNNADDLWLVHTDAAVVPWYEGWRPSREEALVHASRIAESWQLHGVHKWIAYDRVSGQVVGRGGLSRAPTDDDWGQLYGYLPDKAWVREAHPNDRPYRAHAHWLEVGWALRRLYWGCGYASEIGAASLAYAFDVLGVQAVVSCTVRHNLRSRAVMDRIGMRPAGEIRSRGAAEGDDHVRDDAPFAVATILRSDPRPSPYDPTVRYRHVRPLSSSTHPGSRS
jgi:RimJ/RimL family protein N-acetyltransferase